MTRTVVGISCAGFSVALLFYAVWKSVGEARGMASLLAGLGLLLVAVMTLRPSRTGRASK